MIKPTVGRVVWYYPPGKSHTEQPLAALITYVHSDTMINVAFFNANGQSFGDTSVVLLQDDDSYGNPGGGSWARWMPYQKAVAAGALTPTLHA